MTEKYYAIILRTVKYGDTNLIVDTLTRERGRTSFVWRLPSRARGRAGRNLFQPLTICEITAEQRNMTAMPLIREVHVAVPYTTLIVDPVKASVAFFLAEFLVQVSRAEQPDDSFFDFVEKSLQWFDVATEATANFHIMFLVQVSHFLGFHPNMEDYYDNACFDMRQACFCVGIPSHKDFLLPEDARRLALLVRMTPANMHLYKFSRTDRNRVVEQLLKFYSLHIPGFKEMKSWEVLQVLFA